MPSVVLYFMMAEITDGFSPRLTIEAVTGIVEGGAVPPPGPRMKSERMLMAADASTPVEAGSQEIAVTVNVSYRTR